MARKPSASSKRRKKPSKVRKTFRFGRLKLIPIDMRMVYAAYE